MFYEFEHSLASDYYTVRERPDFNYPAHLHHCFEFLCVLEGTMIVAADDITYELNEGEALLIFPNQLHSMKTPAHSRHVLCLFSPKLVNAYSELTTTLLPVNNLFRPNKFLIDCVRKTKNENTENNIVELKGLLYSICGEFHKTAEYRETDAASNSLLYCIFKFINDNYNKNCTLSELAKQIGYDYSYLSRFFKKTVGISYNNYVNQSRISEACYLLQNTKMTVLQISTECGFSSLRSLNRNFKEQTGISPAEYRRKIKHAHS